jgi:hypothetical protein
MEHGLARSGTHVVDGAVAILDATLAPDFRSHELTITEYFGVLRLRRIESLNVLFGDDQHMGWSLRSDILENVNALVFIDLLRGDLPGDDFAE